MADYSREFADVRRDIRESYEPRLRACDRMHDHAMSNLASWTGRAINSAADGIIVALFARSLDTFAAATKLARLGYGAESQMLLRSLFEGMVDAHWVHSDPETADERFHDHWEHGRMLLAEAAQRFPEQYGDVEFPAFDPMERARLDKLYTAHGVRPWSRLNLHERVRLITDQWTQHEGRRTLQFMHDIAHRENNAVLHVTAQSLDDSVIWLDEEERPAFKVGPRPDRVARALFGAFWTFAQTYSLVLDRFNLNVTGRQRAKLFSLEVFYGGSKPEDDA